MDEGAHIKEKVSIYLKIYILTFYFLLGASLMCSEPFVKAFGTSKQQQNEHNILLGLYN